MTLKDNGDGTISITAPCSFNKPKVTVTKHKDKVVAITMTDDEHRITEVLWEAPKPLSDNEIHDIWKSLWEGGNIGHIAYNYARAIEERHGIK